MVDFNFDLENAEQLLDDALDLLSVFWAFFNEKRPSCDDPETFKAAWFIDDCKEYGSVLNAAFDKVREVHKDMVTSINNYCSEAKKSEIKKARKAV